MLLLKVHLFSVIACLAIFFVIYPAEAIPWTSEENKALDADAIAVGRIMSYRDDGAHRYYEISIIKWIKNPQQDQTITMRSITPKVFDPHVPYAIFEKKDLGLFYLKSVDGEWSSTNYSKQIWASELSQTIYDMKKLVGNNSPDSSVSLERICKEGYVNAIKNRTGEIACVKLQTMQKLIQRGWAVDVEEGSVFPDSVKQEILDQLRKEPQNVNGTAQEFIVSEALADARVWDLLKDTKYQVNCCTYTLDGNEFPYPLYVGITFQLNEKDMLITATYDLQQEKITNVETRDGIRTGGVVAFEPKQHVEISLDGFKPAQKVGYPINDFTIKIEGYYPKPHEPDIELVNETGYVIWTNYDDIGHVILGRIGPVEFCKEYQFYDIGDPIIFNNTGTYKLIFTFEEFSLEREIRVFQSTSSVSLDMPDFHCD